MKNYITFLFKTLLLAPCAIQQDISIVSDAMRFQLNKSSFESEKSNYNGYGDVSFYNSNFKFVTANNNK